jgi:hypothetical protein
MTSHNHNALAMGLEQGALALLGSKSTAALTRLAPPSELVLTCCGLMAALHGVPARAPVLGRVSRIMAQALYTITLNTLLQWASDGAQGDVACVSLLAIYFWGGILHQASDVALTAQYLLVASLSKTLRGFQHGEALSAAWALAFVPGLPADAHELARLVTVESFSAWLRDWFPQTLLLPSTALLLYLCAPFVEEFPVLGRMYRFTVFAFTADTNFAAVPAWLTAAGLWALWRAETDPTSKRLAAVAGCNLAIVAVFDALQFAMDNDPAPTLIALLVGIRILEAPRNLAP